METYVQLREDWLAGKIPESYFDEQLPKLFKIKKRKNATA